MFLFLLKIDLTCIKTGLTVLNKEKGCVLSILVKLLKLKGSFLNLIRKLTGIYKDVNECHNLLSELIFVKIILMAGRSGLPRMTTTL